MKKILVVITILSLSLLMIGCSKQNFDSGMKSVGSFNNLKGMISNDRYNGNELPEASLDGDQAPKSKDKTSSTNVQVSGVDEGDIVKVDSDRIYQIYGNHLVITSIQNDMVVLLNETLNDETYHSYFSELYLTEDYLIVIGHSYSFYPGGYDTNDSFMPMYAYGQEKTIVFIYDLISLEKLKPWEYQGI